eukprot:343817-Prymnesium_polylepis.1
MSPKLHLAVIRIVPRRLRTPSARLRPTGRPRHVEALDLRGAVAVVAVVFALLCRRRLVVDDGCAGSGSERRSSGERA